MSDSEASKSVASNSDLDSSHCSNDGSISENFSNEELNKSKRKDTPTFSHIPARGKMLFQVWINKVFPRRQSGFNMIIFIRPLFRDKEEKALSASLLTKWMKKQMKRRNQRKTFNCLPAEFGSLRQVLTSQGSLLLGSKKA